MIILSGLILWTTGVADPDQFEEIKKELAQAKCVRIKFLSIYHSEVFESVDTTYGDGVMANYGYYDINLGPDRYTYDGDYLWSYSSENQQVTKEKVNNQNDMAREMSFITRLDDYYKATTKKSGMIYFLTKINSESLMIPDSMTLYLKENSKQIDKIEYIDENKDLNQIIFKDISLINDCEKEIFIPSFSETVEIIKLN